MALGSAAVTTRRLADAAALDPALGYGLPDVESLVWATIRHLGEDKGAEVRSWTYATSPLPSPRGWLNAVSVQVDVRDTSKQLAYQRADDARRLLLSLPFRPWDSGTVVDCYLLDGPTWLPDPVSGRPRYVIQAVVQVHPARTQGATQ
jgi:hypothetical protein